MLHFGIEICNNMLYYFVTYLKLCMPLKRFSYFAPQVISIQGILYFYTLRAKSPIHFFMFIFFCVCLHVHTFFKNISKPDLLPDSTITSYLNP